MTFWWTHLVADVADWIPGGPYGLGLTVLVLSVLVGLALQPRGLLRGKLARRGDRPAKIKPKAATAEAVDDTLPELPADALTARAEQYMASGDYRRAVREWLRVMVRDLVEAEVVDHMPGWTVTELAGAAGRAAPSAAEPLAEAASIFSEVWYGGRLAGLAEADRMRSLRTAVHSVAGRRPGHGATVAEAWQ